jgi:hypothetical protein
MGELKSAWEIAQEKAERLGRLSQEEEQRQKEERCRESGAAITRRFLDNAHFVSPAAEVERQSQGDQALVREAVLTGLVQALDFEQKNARRAPRVLQALSELDSTLSEKVGQVRQLWQEYEGTVDRVQEQDRERAREILHRLRISGSAIADVNPAGVPQARHVAREVGRSFRPRLEELKRALLDTAGAAGQA